MEQNLAKLENLFRWGYGSIFRNEIPITNRNYIHENSIEAAERIWQNVAIGKRHVIASGLTQSGKTNIAAALNNSWKSSSLNNVMKECIERFEPFSKFYFITGDNQNENISQNKLKISIASHDDFVAMKNSEIKKDLKNIKNKKEEDKSLGELLDEVNSGTVNNSIIVIDESHYGTGDPKNVVNQWLNENNISMHEYNEKLIRLNIVIVSLSATNYLEQCANNTDKAIVYLAPGQGYIGFLEMNEAKMFMPIGRAYKEKNKKRNNADSYRGRIYNEFTSYTKSELERRYNETGEICCSIVSSTSDRGLSRKLRNDSFEIIEVNCSGGKINTKRDIEDVISAYNDKDNDLNAKFMHDHKFPIFVIKNALKQSKSLSPNFKYKRIVSMFAYCPNYTNAGINTTKQWLAGRYCGYPYDYNGNIIESWSKCKIWINEEHLNKILEADKAFMDMINKRCPFQLDVYNPDANPFNYDIMEVKCFSDKRKNKTDKLVPHTTDSDKFYHFTLYDNDFDDVIKPAIQDCIDNPSSIYCDEDEYPIVREKLQRLLDSKSVEVLSLKGKINRYVKNKHISERLFYYYNEKYHNVETEDAYIYFLKSRNFETMYNNSRVSSDIGDKDGTFIDSMTKNKSIVEGYSSRNPDPNKKPFDTGVKVYTYAHIEEGESKKDFADNVLSGKVNHSDYGCKLNSEEEKAFETAVNAKIVHTYSHEIINGKSSNEQFANKALKGMTNAATNRLTLVENSKAFETVVKADDGWIVELALVTGTPMYMSVEKGLGFEEETTLVPAYSDMQKIA